MAGGDAVQLFLLNQLPEILVAKLAGSRLGAEVLAAGVGFDIAAAAMKLQLVPMGQFRDELLVGVGLGPAQIVIEVDDGKHNAEFLAQFEQDAQQRDGIGSA